MPGPSSVVFFVDDDDDEFPVRIMGEWMSLNDTALLSIAEKEAKALIDRGVFRPNGELRFEGKIERMNPIEDHE